MSNTCLENRNMVPAFQTIYHSFKWIKIAIDFARIVINFSYKNMYLPSERFRTSKFN